MTTVKCQASDDLQNCAVCLIIPEIILPKLCFFPIITLFNVQPFQQEWAPATISLDIMPLALFRKVPFGAFRNAARG